MLKNFEKIVNVSVKAAQDLLEIGLDENDAVE